MRLRLIIIGYAAVALVTFGKSASEPRECWDISTGDERLCDVRSVSATAFFAGILWPFYWSWEAADEIRFAARATGGSDE